MNKLLQQIETVRSKLDGWRRMSLKESQTRITVIDPVLEALGWDVRDPDEVEHEYPTVDNKSVDYALKINRKTVLLVEAKPLDDSLSDVKAVTQVVGYAANDGIDWCVLTNGITWKVYKSSEKCPAPEKLMYEVTIGSRSTEGVPVRQLAEQLWRLSREEMAKGTLDIVGEQTFTDSKVRKALDEIVRDPSRSIIQAIRDRLNEPDVSLQRIKDSLTRIWFGPTQVAIHVPRQPRDTSATRKIAGKKASATRKKGTRYDEVELIAGKPKEVIELYRALDSFCLGLGQERVEKKCLKHYVTFAIPGRSIDKVFCSILLQQGGLRVYLKLKYNAIQNPPSFARDMTGIGHYGTGNFELAINNLNQLEHSKLLIRQSFEAIQ